MSTTSKRVIWKFPLDVCREQEIGLHRVHDLLTIQVQNGQPTLWAMVHPETKPLSVMIRCYGTGNGNPLPDDEYIGTVQLDGFVWHYYKSEGGDDPNE